MTEVEIKESVLITIKTKTGAQKISLTREEAEALHTELTLLFDRDQKNPFFPRWSPHTIYGPIKANPSYEVITTFDDNLKSPHQWLEFDTTKYSYYVPNNVTFDQNNGKS